MREVPKAVDTRQMDCAKPEPAADLSSYHSE
jgi:hypothetical protein